MKATADDIAKLETDIGTFVTSMQSLIPAATALVHDLEAIGVDAVGFFQAYASGQKHALPPMGSTLAAVNWQHLLQVLETYGPVVYAFLASIFGWPPIPFPIPKPAQGEASDEENL